MKKNIEVLLEVIKVNNEIWKPIKGYEGFYEVSNFGRVKSLERKVKANFHFGNTRTYKERILKSGNVKGYQQVTLRNGISKHEFIHRLVAEAFVPNPKGYKTINHIDGNKKNNCADNLEWCTQKENVRHAWKTGLVDKEKKIEHMRRLGINKIGLIKRWGLNNKEIIGGKYEEDL